MHNGLRVDIAEHFKHKLAAQLLDRAPASIGSVCIKSQTMPTDRNSEHFFSQDVSGHGMDCIPQFHQPLLLPLATPTYTPSISFLRHRHQVSISHRQSCRLQVPPSAISAYQVVQVPVQKPCAKSGGLHGVRRRGRLGNPALASLVRV